MASVRMVLMHSSSSDDADDATVDVAVSDTGSLRNDLVGLWRNLAATVPSRDRAPASCFSGRPHPCHLIFFDSVHLLTFSLDGDRYGLDAIAVRSIERAVAITPLPRSPDAVEGVIDVHGDLAPVFDLRRRFGKPPRALHGDEHLVIASARGRLVAFRVDEALDLVSVADDVARVPPLADRSLGEGVARLEDGAVVIYDLSTFLSAAEAAMLEAALQSIESARDSEASLATNESTEHA